MALFRRRVVFLVDLDRLVRLARDQPRSGLVVCHGEDPGLRVQRSGLNGSLEPLEVVARFPVPEIHSSVVRAGHQDTVGVDGHAVDDRVVTGQVLDEVSLGALPLLDVVGGGGGEHVEVGVEHDRPD